MKRKNFKAIFFIPALILTGILFSQCKQEKDTRWDEDFSYQPVAERPALEVSYTDSSRTAFQILAEEYQLTGQLEKPHLLTGAGSREWLWMEIEDSEGTVWSTRNSPEPSRINLYRRGPYFSEIHWFDLQVATPDGTVAPLKGDLALYCYPEKMLAEVTWHGTGDFDAKELRVKGIAPASFSCESFKEGVKQPFHFPVFGEEEPLPDTAFTLHEGETSVTYNARKGYYSVGSVTSGSFQKEFYETPNLYETVAFSLKNDSTPRKIYICHESVVGGCIVEGGMVLDEGGHPLPVTVQVSKNFAGEKEEKFYNPEDTPFSETFFPLYLDPGEEHTLTSYHLYQNWGRHMTKHWSSLGAWMDYFHSSTGVTETTCYVPFKFAGLGGVSIADFRAMSQKTYWRGQPQHDNIAGHSFLNFYDGEKWQHLKYESTVYRSTGPNWFDIQLNYISSDGSIKATADIWETPQSDELRSFFNVRYEVLKPLSIADAQANFRFLSITSAIQRLRYNRFAATGTGIQEIDFEKSPFPFRGVDLPSENAFLAVLGDSIRNRGSNGIVIRRFSGPGNTGPAASLQTGKYLERFQGDTEKGTRLLLVPDTENLELKKGDVFEIDGFWLPYGARDNAEAPRREAVRYANGLPEVTACPQGTVLSHLPVKIKAENNRARFSIKGGKDYIPVIITGLSKFRYPRIWKKEGDEWRLLSHARNSAHDGYQVFCDEAGDFGAVFLVHSDSNEQELKVQVGEPVDEPEKIKIEAVTAAEGTKIPPVRFASPFSEDQFQILFPIFESTPALDWKASEGSSLWLESVEGAWRRGGRITPNNQDVDLEYWWQNDEAGLQHEPQALLIDLEGTAFEDETGERTFVFKNGAWEKIPATGEEKVPGTGIIAVQSADGEKLLCMAWPNAIYCLRKEGTKVGVALDPVDFPLTKRYHLRGKIYLFEGGREVLLDRIRKEQNVL